MRRLVWLTVVSFQHFGCGLERVCRLVWDKACALQLTIEDSHRFEAHATIFKTSKAKRNKGRVRKEILPLSYYMHIRVYIYISIMYMYFDILSI